MSVGNFYNVKFKLEIIRWTNDLHEMPTYYRSDYKNIIKFKKILCLEVNLVYSIRCRGPWVKFQPFISINYKTLFWIWKNIVQFISHTLQLEKVFESIIYYIINCCK